MSENQETLVQYVGDQLSLARHIHQAIERQMKHDDVKKSAEANALINKIDGMLEGQISSLEQHLTELGGDPTSPVKEAVSSVFGVAAGLYDKVRTDPVSKMLRDDYTALSLAAISLTLLNTTGLALKSQRTADLAVQQLQDISPIIVEISEVIPKVVVPELMDAGKVVDAGVAEQSIKATQKAWKPSNTNQSV
ncbi:MAG TPA: hypothetical protein VFT66_25690 [Roseiflexaceae bacterium]|jgi:hypothetical protein|nr:hypothetical protein [Roseiflexaceae bacterium]